MEIRNALGGGKSTLEAQWEDKGRNLKVLHVHRDQMDSLSQIDVANNIGKDSEHRLHVFGKITFLIHYTSQLVHFKSCGEAYLRPPIEVMYLDIV